MPEVRAFFVGAQRIAHDELSRLWFETPEGAEITPEARRVGAFLQAMLLGLMGQYLIDPAQAASAADLTEALRTMVGGGAVPAPAPAS